ncbi:MAG: FHA domain-containing protein [Phycisphaerae bacterium]
MASLKITSGEKAGSHYPLAKRPLTGGRDPARDIQILDPKVGRRHFQIRMRDADYVVVDFQSRNGVYVNGEKINVEQTLRDGDEILIGDTRLVFSISDDPDRTDALQKHKDAGRHAREDRTITD